ncbi:hypothetical protein GF380_05895 [Candidatus Uhrbacteria bacterium]|nr:hypothetical protein [Candidatus Uhrbacteria bacterium]MBD3284523.1 hypothetical protein [Candidatus Uhrbacteria bacterium]
MTDPNERSKTLSEMTLEERVAFVKDVERFNKYRLKHPDEPVDLHEAYLDGAKLNGADLNVADLSGANLTEAFGLTSASLVGVNWTGVRGVRREIVQASHLLTQATIAFADD